jgi:hypothetical protein
MNFVSILQHWHPFPEDDFGREVNCSVTFLPWVKTHGYKAIAPLELIIIEATLYQFHLTQSHYMWARGLSWQRAGARNVRWEPR